MNIGDLITKLSALDRTMPVFVRRQHVTGNILEVDLVERSTYGFFGCKADCVILKTHLDLTPEEKERLENEVDL